MSPDSVIRLFSPKDQAKLGPVSGWVSNQKVKIYNYARWYRTIQAPTKHIMVDMPVKWDAALSKGVVPPATVHRLPGRFPSHVEPYETPRPELAAIWGYNTTEDKTLSSVATGTASVPALNVDPALDYTLQYRNLVKAEGNPGVTAGTGTPIGTFGEPIDGKFPLVLTTIRCVEHFQSGPITRNNTANDEAEPWAWIEINSIDAMKYGITDGQWVEVETARGNSTTSQTARTANYTADAANVADKFARGFKARVGVGLQSNQRVAPGVVAIPWHYGDRGLATGSRANDLTIDAFDANTTIPEYKACLCKIKSAADQSA
jgi:anaerobic selenocysteine-containing dehydrogenase